MQQKQITAPMQKKITFKSTLTSFPPLSLAYQSEKTFQQYKQQLAVHYKATSDRIKLIFKGKILADKTTAQAAQLNKVQSPIIIVTIAPAKKQQKPKPYSQQQVAQNLEINKNTESNAPGGILSCSISNLPQYAQKIAGVLNEQKIQQMMDDPNTQQMLIDMIQDPEILAAIIQKDPMAKKMFQDYPMLKNVLANKQMAKMFFNPEIMKAGIMMKKNAQQNSNQNMNMLGNGSSGITTQNQSQSSLMSSNFNIGFQLGLNSVLNQYSQNQNNNSFLSNTNTNQQQNNSFGNMEMGANPYLGMNMNNPYMMNPYMNMMGNGGFNNMNNTNKQTDKQLQQKWQVELVQLQSMGLQDKSKNLETLKACFGNVQAAIQRLFKK